MGLYFLPMLLSMLISGFTGGDILDFSSTDGYWKAKHITVTLDQLKEDAKEPPAVGDIAPLVKDLSSAEFKVRDAARKKIEAMGAAALPQLEKVGDINDDEAAETIDQLKRKLTGHVKAREVRRLMAIRTLGEKKEASAVPLLEEAAKSKDLFVAEYATRAIALIQGKSAPAPQFQKIDQDPLLLPADVNIVAQLTGLPGSKQPTIESFVEAGFARMGVMMGGGENAEEKQKRIDDATTQIYQKFLDVVERTGPFRAEGVTVAYSAGKDQKDWFALILRGHYDHLAFAAALKDMTRANAAEEKETDYGFPVVTMRGSGALLFPNDNLAIAVTTFGSGGGMERVVADFAAAVKTGKGAMADAPMAAKIKKLQAGAGPAWGLLEATDDMKDGLAIFKAMPEIILTSSLDEKKKTIAFSFAGEGKDPDAVKAASAELDSMIKQAIGQISNAPEGVVPKDVVAVYQSLKVETKDAKAALTGSITSNLSELSLSIMGSMFMGMGGW